MNTIVFFSFCIACSVAELLNFQGVRDVWEHPMVQAEVQELGNAFKPKMEQFGRNVENMLQLGEAKVKHAFDSADKLVRMVAPEAVPEVQYVNVKSPNGETHFVKLEKAKDNGVKIHVSKGFAKPAPQGAGHVMENMGNPMHIELRAPEGL